MSTSDFPTAALPKTRCPQAENIHVGLEGAEPSPFVTMHVDGKTENSSAVAWTQEIQCNKDPPCPQKVPPEERQAALQSFPEGKC